MGRQQLDLAERRDPQLHARAAELVAGDPLLDDAAALGRAWPAYAVERHASAARTLIAASRRATAASLVGVARRRQVAQVDAARCPRPTRPRSASRAPARCSGLLGAQRGDRVDRVVDRGRSLHARAGAARPPRRRAAGSRSWCRGGSAAGRRRTSGCRARSARSRSSSVVLYGTRCARSRIEDQRRGSARAGAAARAASAISGRDEPSSGDTRNSRLRAWLGITPGSRSR